MVMELTIMNGRIHERNPQIKIFVMPISSLPDSRYSFTPSVRDKSRRTILGTFSPAAQNLLHQHISNYSPLTVDWARQSARTTIRLGNLEKRIGLTC